MSLKLFYKVGCSPGFFTLRQDLDPLISAAERMLPVNTFKIQNLQKTESGKLRWSTENYARFTEIMPELWDVTPELRRAFFFWQLSAKH